jgi:hypothetical protein
MAHRPTKKSAASQLRPKAPPPATPLTTKPTRSLSRSRLQAATEEDEERRQQLRASERQRLLLEQEARSRHGQASGGGATSSGNDSNPSPHRSVDEGRHGSDSISATSSAGRVEQLAAERPVGDGRSPLGRLTHSARGRLATDHLRQLAEESLQNVFATLVLQNDGLFGPALNLLGRGLPPPPWLQTRRWTANETDHLHRAPGSVPPRLHGPRGASALPVEGTSVVAALLGALLAQLSAYDSNTPDTGGIPLPRANVDLACRDVVENIAQSLPDADDFFGVRYAQRREGLLADVRAALRAFAEHPSPTDVADPGGDETASAGDDRDATDDERRGEDNDALGGGTGDGGTSSNHDSDSDGDTVRGEEDPPNPPDPEDPEDPEQADDDDDDDGIMANNRKVRPLSSIKATDWLAWKRHFQATYGITNWDDDRKKNEMLAAMDGEASTATASIDPDGMTFAQMLAAYEGCFITQAGSELAESEFNAARQLPDETILMFHARMRELFNRAFPNENTEGNGLARHLRKNFTWGLESSQITTYVWDRRPATYAECLRLAQEKYSTQIIADDRKKGHGRGSVHAMGPSGSSGNEPTCWGCGQSGHVLRNCPPVLKAEERGILVKKGREGVSAVKPNAGKGRNRNTGPAGRQRGRGNRPGGARGRVGAMEGDESPSGGGSNQDESGNGSGAGL